jgi:hypothetical protein
LNIDRRQLRFERTALATGLHIILGGKSEMCDMNEVEKKG